MRLHLVLIMIASVSFGNTVNFDHSEGSTGSLIEGVRNISLTTNVPEVEGLNITARSDNEDHKLFFLVCFCGCFLSYLTYLSCYPVDSSKVWIPVS